MDLEQSIKKMYEYFTELNKSVSLIQWHYKDKFIKRQMSEVNKGCGQNNSMKPLEDNLDQPQVIQLVPEVVVENQVTEQNQTAEQNQIINQTQTGNQQITPDANDTKVFTVEELQQYDGTNGKPAYIAVDGVVYDVTNEARWAGGRHFGVKAGTDGTTNYMQCHGKSGAVNKLKKIGVVAK